MFIKSKRQLLSSAILILLTGCSILPGTGPHTKSITETIENSKADASTVDAEYTTVRLNSKIVDVIGPPIIQTMPKIFAGVNQIDNAYKINVGSSLIVTIWDSSEMGSLSSAKISGVPISVTVESNGKVFVPFVGDLQVLDKTTTQVREEIVSALKGNAIDPQVQVVIAEHSGYSLSVLGDVNQQINIIVPPSGLRLLDAIALAGGAKAPSYESEIVLVRENNTMNLRMGDAIYTPANNISLMPMDTVQVLHKPKSYAALGAVDIQSKQHFDQEQLFLSDALAQVGGLNDNLADSSGVFLFRFETEERLNQIGAHIPNNVFKSGLATIYIIDFKEPGALFLANSFAMHDKDILYVSNASGSDFKKFVDIILAPIAMADRFGK